MNDLGETSARQPQYVALSNSLIRDIRSGKYGVGDLLPPETEIAKRFGLSRHTVREAIRVVQEMGLVTRHQGIGTRVKAKEATSEYVQNVKSIGDLFQYVKDVRLKVQSAEECVADENLAIVLKCKKGQHWLKITGVRHSPRSARPICFTTVYVHYAFEAIREFLGKSQVPIYALIEQNFGEKIREVEQQISAGAIDTATAKALSVEPDSPGLVISRHYYSQQERLVEVSLNVYPWDRFSYSMRLGLDLNTEDSSRSSAR